MVGGVLLCHERPAGAGDGCSFDAGGGSLDAAVSGRRGVAHRRGRKRVYHPFHPGARRVCQEPQKPVVQQSKRGSKGQEREAGSADSADDFPATGQSGGGIAGEHADECRAQPADGIAVGSGDFVRRIAGAGAEHQLYCHPIQHAPVVCAAGLDEAFRPKTQ